MTALPASTPLRPMAGARGLRRGGCGLVISLLAALGTCAWAQTVPPRAAPGGAPAGAPIELRVLGGLAGINQYTRHEEPFWTQRLPQVSGGRLHADIMPFDRAGVRGPELLSLLRNGTVGFATVLLTVGAPQDPELGAPDLAGLNPDMAQLRRSVGAYRAHLQSTLHQRYGLELLAVYTYPAQVLFCRTPIEGLTSLRGLRVRTSGTSQSDWVEALGAQPVTTPFAQIPGHLQSGAIDCAITGTMSGHSIGLHTLTTHQHTMAVNWGLSVVLANADIWSSLPSELRTLLQRELAALESAIWADAERDTELGTACNAGRAACPTGRQGRMQIVATTAADEQRRRELFAATVLPRWLQRCGPDCAALWNRTLATGAGVRAPAFGPAPAVTPPARAPR